MSDVGDGEVGNDALDVHREDSPEISQPTVNDHNRLSSHAVDMDDVDNDNSGVESPVPVFFSADQMLEALASVINGLTKVAEDPSKLFSILAQEESTTTAAPTSARHAKTPRDSSKTPRGSKTPRDLSDLHLPLFLRVSPLFSEGEFVELQPTVFSMVRNFLHEFYISHRSQLHAVAAQVNAARLRVDPEADDNRDVAATSIQQTVIPRSMGGYSAPPRRNPVIASAVAAAKSSSLFRPQTAGLPPTKGGHVPHQEANNNNSTFLSEHVSNGNTTPRTTMSTLLSPDELVSQTFQEVERHLKDERGQSRFSSAEYFLEQNVRDVTNTDSREKTVSMSDRDAHLLAHLEPKRRHFMMKYFGDPKRIERRRKEVLADEMLKQARQMKIASNRSGSAGGNHHHSNRDQPMAQVRTALPPEAGHDNNVPHMDAASSPLPLPVAAEAVPSQGPLTGEQKKLWSGAQNEMDVWNAVRTRPASAAASLPVGPTIARPASSIVARTFFPQPKPERQPQRSNNMSFAEMVSLRRKEMLGDRSTDDLSGANDSRHPSPDSTIVQLSRSTLINGGDGGFHSKKETFAQAVGNDKEVPLTTIVTAAYLPMSQKAPPSVSLLAQGVSSPKAQRKGKKTKLSSFGREGRKAESDEDTAVDIEVKAKPANREIPFSSTPERRVRSQNSANSPERIVGSSSSAGAVASAAAIRITRLKAIAQTTKEPTQS